MQKSLRQVCMWEEGGKLYKVIQTTVRNKERKNAYFLEEVVCTEGTINEVSQGNEHATRIFRESCSTLITYEIQCKQHDTREVFIRFSLSTRYSDKQSKNISKC